MAYAAGNKEDHMLDYSIMKPEGILVLKPQAPLSKEDFGGLSAAVDSYLSDHSRLKGVQFTRRDSPAGRASADLMRTCILSVNTTRKWNAWQS